MRLYLTRDDVDMEQFKSRVEMMMNRKRMLKGEYNFASHRVDTYKELRTRRSLTIDEMTDERRYMEVAERSKKEYDQFWVHIQYIFPLSMYDHTDDHHMKMVAAYHY